MDYEKKYKDALEWARKVMQGKVGFVLDEVLEKFPELKESEDMIMVKFIKNQLFNIKKTITENYELDAKLTKAIDWLERQSNLMKALQISNARIGELIEKNYYLKEQLEKQGNNMGISEATKKKLEDNLNKALEKETPESWNEFLDEQGEQKPIVKTQMVYPKFRIGDVISPNVEDGKGDYTIVGFNEALADYLVDGGNIPSCSIGIEFIDANFHIKEHKHVEHTRNEILSELVAEKWHYLINDCKLGSVVNVKLPFNWFDWLCRWFYASGEQSVEQKPAEVGPRQEELTEFEKAVKQVMKEAIECGDTHNLKADADLLLRIARKTSWSEEDEKMFEHIIAKATLHFSSINYLDEEEINFLKSLKDRYTWKPSDEQMDALHYVTNFDYGGHKATLVSLYEQLKKLREE